jgi:hypothetical protein
VKKSELAATAELLNKVKATLISSGMPYSNVRDIDAALNVIERIQQRTNKKAS